MKNVTKILTAVTFCAALFASDQRISALGGNAAFWPGDEANIVAFPAQVNNHAYLQISGIGGGEAADLAGTGAASILWQEDGTTWGFNYGSDDWVNMHWGNGDMGVTVGLESTTGANAAGDKSDMSVSWGGDFGFGEMGIHYKTVNNGDDDAELGVNWRKDCGFWIFDNTVVSSDNLMADDLAFGADFWTAKDAGGASVVFGWGVDYNGAAGSAAVAAVADDPLTADIDETVVAVDAVDVVTMKQTATIGVEANMTDWATLRGGYNWSHTLACDNGAPGDDSCGDNASSFMWGLGFNWGGLTADLTVDSGLFQDPIGAVTGYDDGGLTTKTVTLTYSF